MLPTLWSVYSRCYDSIKRLKPYEALYEWALREGGLQDSQPAPLRVLDVGTGTGNARQYAGPGARWHLIDGCWPMLRRAMAKFGDDPGVSYQWLDFTSARGRAALEGRFDVLLSVNALYNEPDPVAHLAWLLEHAAPGAVLVLAGPWSNPSIEAVLDEHDRLVRRAGGRPHRLLLLLANLPALFVNLLLQRRLRGAATAPRDEAELRGWLVASGWRGACRVESHYGGANFAVSVRREAP